jgi:hypothetical protein
MNFYQKINLEFRIKFRFFINNSVKFFICYRKFMIKLMYFFVHFGKKKKARHLPSSSDSD